MDKEQLEKIGLTKNESSIYYSLLELGSTNADPIIKKTGLHRNIVYDNLDKLIKKGLVGFVIKNNRKYFEATQSKKILDFVKEKKKDILEKEKIAENLFPQIERLRKLNKDPKEALIIQGKKGVINLIMQLVEEGNVDMFATGWGMRTFFPIEYEKFNNLIKKLKKNVRAIITEKMKEEDQGLAICKFLPDNFVLPVNTSITKDKVVIFMFDKDPIAILIRSKDVANSYRSYFNALWKVAK